MDFEEMYATCFRKVYRFALTLTHNSAEAEEIAQETFFRAMNHVSTLSPDTAIDAWLMRIAHNLFVSSLRKRKHIDPGADTESIASKHSLEDQLDDSLQAAQILHLLHDLEEPYKEVFTLRTLGDVSYAQIASLFGKGENWARVVYFRARKKLLELMKKEEGE